jgi:UDP-N-acetylmuramoyl-tripeptide--D-alanyl-D-alanine ligase
MMDVLASVTAKRRIAVVGEMLELGASAPDLHARCGARAAQKGIDILIGVRGNAEHLVRAAKEAGMKAQFVETPEAAGEWLARNVRPGDAILLKASRGVRLEKALEIWQAKLNLAAKQV